MGLFERWLTLWVALCIVVGIVLGGALPGLFQALGRSGITIVYVTHEPEVAGYASRAVVVRDGKIESDRHQTPMQVDITERAAS